MTRDRYDPADFHDAVARLTAATSEAEVAELIEADAVFDSPVFHEWLLISRDAAVRPVWRRLSDYLQLRALVAYRPEDAIVTQHKPTATLPFMPDYYAALCKLLRDRLPTNLLRDSLDPATAAREIGDELVTRGVGSSEVPSFAYQTGTLWGAHIVRCTHCEKRRLAIRAFYVDVRRAPHFIDSLRSGALNSDVCPECGWHAVLLEHTWLSERRRPSSLLGPLACLWRLDDFEWVYQPPNWLPRDPAMDLVVEDCADSLLNELDTPHLMPGDRQRPLKMLIAHSREELIQYLAGDQPFMDLSRHHASLIHALAHRLENERISFADAYDFATTYIRASGGDWLIPLVENPGDDSERPMRVLAVTIVSEAAAEYQGLPAETRAILAIATARCLMLAGWTALAERKLVEAEQRLLNAGKLDAASLQILAEAHGDLASRQGRHNEALDLRRGVSTVLPGREAPAADRVEYWRQQGRIALSLKNAGHRKAALTAFTECIRSLEDIVGELASTASENVELHRMARRALSGAIANLAGLHIEVATDCIVAMQRVLLAPTGADLEPASHDLLQLFGATSTRFDDLARHALTLLRRAQEISRDLHDWEYLSAQLFRQCQACALLHDSSGIDSLLPEWLEVAGKSGRYRDVFLANRQAALSSWRKELLPCSLEHLRDAARALLQDELSDVGTGDPSPEAIDLRAIAIAIATTPKSSLDIIRGSALVAEALKGFRTGQALRIGIAGRLAARWDSQLSQLQEDREHERSQLKYSDAGTPEAHQAERAIEIFDQKIQAVRHRHAVQDVMFQRWFDPMLVSLDALSSFDRQLDGLGPRTTFVGIELANGGVTVYALWAGGATVTRVDWPDYDEDVQRLRRAIQDGDSTASLDRIAHLLLSPLKERLGILSPRDRIIISPAGPFFAVPFAALRYQGRPLCETATVSVVHGLSGFRECGARPVQLRSLLAVGCPERDGEPPIPWTADEANDVRQQFLQRRRGADRLLRGEATIARLCERVSNADVLHLGCHGSWSSGSMGAYLHLSPDHATGDSGDLTAARIAWEVPLRPGALVVIAACDSAIHVDEGDQLTGIVPAFLLAGAGAVVAASWPVGDRQTRTFQRSFYESLLAGGGVADALAETQRACIHGELGEDLCLAEHWSAFTVFGVA